MYRELTNLLPRSRIMALRRDYFLRLGSVAVTAVAVLMLIHGVLLAPSYIFVAQQISFREAALAVLEASLATDEEREADMRLSVLRDDPAYLTRLASVSTASAAIRGVLAL